MNESAVRVDLTAWRLADGSSLLTLAGAPAAVVQLPDFTPPNLNGAQLALPAPRKALPAPKRERKVKARRKSVKKAARAPKVAVRRPKPAKGPLTCESCRKEFPRNRGLPAKRCPDCRAGKAPAPKARAVPAMATVTAPEISKGSRVHTTPPRRCNECGVKTNEDPCHSCKAPWDRKR